jgi:tetratricopeptide (TPR) repeat protein
MGGNVIIIAAKRKINLENLDTEEPVKNLDLRILDSSEVNAMRERAQGVVLTDNYAPVENLLAPAVLEMAVRSLAMKYLEQAENLRKDGKWDESVLKDKAVVSVYPQFSIAAYGGMGQVFANQGRWEKAISAAKSALEYNARAEIKQSMSIFHHNIGFALKKLGRNDEASQYIHKAIEGYREDLSKEPDSVETVRWLGNILAENGDFSEATKYFRQAVNMAPYDVENHSLLVKVLAVQGRYDEAVEQLYKGVRLMRDNGQEDDAVTLERLLKLVESRKSEIR